MPHNKFAANKNFPINMLNKEQKTKREVRKKITQKRKEE